MIISKTPLRISYAGGGTDLPAYYQRYGGMVISSTINKYVYVLITKRYDDEIVVGYSKQENVVTIDQIEHNLVRECARLVGLKNGFEIKTLSDIPSTGSGLGSSSAITIGLLNAMHSYMNEQISGPQLAKEACKIEIDILGNPIGKQDQYACAIGGLNIWKFQHDEAVIRDSQDNIKNYGFVLIPTNIAKNSSNILLEQNKNINNNLENYAKLKNLVLKYPEYSLQELMSKDWEIKKKLSSDICTPEIQNKIEFLYDQGADYCKLLGSGGGGHILAYADNYQSFLASMRLAKQKYIEFEFENQGSHIIFNQKDG